MMHCVHLAWLPACFRLRIVRIIEFTGYQYLRFALVLRVFVGAA
jgi:hypothetical protein